MFCPGSAETVSRSPCGKGHGARFVRRFSAASKKAITRPVVGVAGRWRLRTRARTAEEGYQVGFVYWGERSRRYWERGRRLVLWTRAIKSGLVVSASRLRLFRALYPQRPWIVCEQGSPTCRPISTDSGSIRLSSPGSNALSAFSVVHTMHMYACR